MTASGRSVWDPKRYLRSPQTYLDHARYLIEAARERATDRRLGITTVGNVTIEGLGIAAGHGGMYIPSPGNALSTILPPSEVAPSDVFVDFGSGKGRVVCQAASYPFKTVIGLDVSEPINEIARENVRRSLPKSRCKDVRIVTADATAYQLPSDASVLYFYNPFEGSVFEVVIENVIRSLEAHPRPIRLIYLNPTSHGCLLRRGFRVIRKKAPSSYRADNLPRYPDLAASRGRQYSLVMYTR